MVGGFDLSPQLVRGNNSRSHHEKRTALAPMLPEFQHGLACVLIVVDTASSIAINAHSTGKLQQTAASFATADASVRYCTAR